MSVPLLAVLAVAVVLAVRAVAIWLLAIARSAARKARLFGLGAGFGIVAAAAAHLPTGLAAAVLALLAFRMLTRPGIAWWKL